jgi:hypothetical protein
MFIPEDPGRRRKRAYSGFWRINGAWSSRLTPPKYIYSVAAKSLTLLTAGKVSRHAQLQQRGVRCGPLTLKSCEYPYSHGLPRFIYYCAGVILFGVGYHSAGRAGRTLAAWCENSEGSLHGPRRVYVCMCARVKFTCTHAVRHTRTHTCVHTNKHTFCRRIFGDRNSELNTR